MKLYKTCLIRCYAPWVYDDPDLPAFKVTSTFWESGAYRVYMYAEPSSSGQPVGVGGYVNGTILKVIDYFCDEKGTYCFCIGPDEHTGFVRIAWLTYESGPYPDPIP